MVKRLLIVVGFSLILLFFVTSSFALQTSRVGIRGGLGTDINLGIAFGVGGNFLLAGGSPIELGAYLFKNHSSESSYEYGNEYNETTDVLVFALLSNFLFNYEQGKTGSFFTAGTGAGIMMVNWEEESPTDESLGELLPGGGSRQDADGTAAGLIVSLGWGMAFSEVMDFRVEAPIFVVMGAPGEASAVVPTFIATLGYAF